jgi:DNA-directed RNA polymerase
MYKAPIKSHLLTKDKDSLILGRGNDVGQHVNKSAINKLQSVAWAINEDILHLLADTLKPSEKPISSFEQSEREKSFVLRDKETNEIIDYLLENGNKFYFGWRYDKRCRMYSQGYHVNPQGNEYRKAMLSYSDTELLTKEGIQYLKYDIANALGFDKDTWFVRNVGATKVINDVFYKIINNEKYTRNIIDIEDMIVSYSTKADTPLLFIKAMYAYYNGVILGKPIGHNMGLDASSSGIQIMSTLAGCTTGAKHSNVLPMITREYTEEVAEKLAELEAELASL